MNLPQEIHGCGEDVHGGARRGALKARAVLEQLDAGGGRGDAFLEDAFSEQGVDKGALAGIKLADDDQQEEVLELAEGHADHGVVFGRGVRARQRGLQVAELATHL